MGNRSASILLVYMYIIKLNSTNLSPYTIHVGDYSALEPPSKPDKPEPLKFEEQFEIPLSTNNIGVFMGSGGRYIKEICSKYGVSVRLGEKSQGGRGERVPHRSYMYATGDKVKVTVNWSGDTKVEIEGFKNELLRRSKVVKEKREQHFASVSLVCVQCTCIIVS